MKRIAMVLIGLMMLSLSSFVMAHLRGWLQGCLENLSLGVSEPSENRWLAPFVFL